MLYDFKSININKELLDKQVKALLEMRFSESYTMATKHKAALDGVIEMLEFIQDKIDKEK